MPEVTEPVLLKTYKPQPHEHLLVDTIIQLDFGVSGDTSADRAEHILGVCKWNEPRLKLFVEQNGRRETARQLRGIAQNFRESVEEVIAADDLDDC